MFGLRSNGNPTRKREVGLCTANESRRAGTAKRFGTDAALTMQSAFSSLTRRVTVKSITSLRCVWRRARSPARKHRPRFLNNI